MEIKMANSLDVLGLKRKLKHGEEILQQAE